MIWDNETDREAHKELIKETIKEWLDEKSAEFGKFTIKYLFSAALAAGVYFLAMHGWLTAH